MPRAAAPGTASSRPWSASRARAVAGARGRRRGRGRRRPPWRLAEPDVAAPARSASASSTASSAAASSPGSLVLLGGEPGIGKSTLLLQAAAGVAERRARPCSTRPARSRPRRSACAPAASGCSTGRPATRVRVARASTRSGGSSRSPAPSGPPLVVVDSIQTATVDELDGPAGQRRPGPRSRRCGSWSSRRARAIAVVLVGHVTKDGSLAGPKTLEHLVDAVLDLEGERYAALRLVRASKNRFGSTEEVGVFEMGERGPASRSPTRPARSSPTTRSAAPGQRRRADARGQPAAARRGPGARRAGRLRDAARARRAASTRTGSALLVAVLGRRAGVGLGSHDVYANLAGGLTVDEPGLDLPLALALASSLRDRADRPGHGRDRRGRAARRAAAGRRARAAAARGRAARVRAGDRPARPRRGRRRAPRVDGPRDRRGSARLRDAIEAALGRPSRRRGEAVPRDARLTVRSAPSRPRRPPAHPIEGPVIRNIRLPGRRPRAASSGSPSPRSAGGLFEPAPAYAGALLAAWVVAWIVVGFAILPYLTVVPARWLIRARPGALDRRVRDGRRRPAARAAHGPAARPAAVAASPARSGRWLPLGVSLFLGLGMVGLTVAKRDDLLVAAEAIGLVRRPDAGRRRAPRAATRTSSSTRARSSTAGSRTSSTPGFLYGTLVVPRFVLDELQHIADSSDTLRRNRGRRGLEILARMQKEPPTPVEIVDEDVPDVAEVDAKLVALAQAPEPGDPDQRLQPQPGRRAAGRPGPEHQLAGERGQAGRAARRGAPRPGDPGGQGGRARASASSTTAR